MEVDTHLTEMFECKIDIYKSQIFLLDVDCSYLYFMGLLLIQHMLSTAVMELCSVLHLTKQSH